MPKAFDDDDPHALELYHAGLTDAKIAAEMYVVWETVYQWRKRNGLPANGRKCGNTVPESDKAAYQREYRSRNRDRINAHHREWCRRWRKDHPDEVREINRKHREKVRTEAAHA